MIQFYGYKRCSTCRKGEKLLEELNVEFEFIDITTNPPSRDELQKIFDNSEEDIKKFFNTSGVVYREEKMKDKVKTMSESEKLDALAANGKLMKRPLVTDGSKVTVGFKEEVFREIWG